MKINSVRYVLLQMLSIGTEVIRNEIVYTPLKLERIEYIATTYTCSECKDTEEHFELFKV